MNIYGKGLKEANAVTSIDFSHSGYYVTTGYDSGMCVSWNTVTAECEKTMEHNLRVSSMEYQPNGNSLVTGCWDKCLRIWV